MRETELEAMAFRQAMPVNRILLLGRDGAYPVCLQCGGSLEREYQRFCDRCGQRLSWRGYKRAQVVSSKRMER